MTTTTDGQVPMPAGATDISDWTDVGTPDEFRTFTGPTPYIDPPSSDMYMDGHRSVTLFGTQLRDGTVEMRCIRLSGVSWEDELDSQTARAIGNALLEAANQLDRLGQR